MTGLVVVVALVAGAISTEWLLRGLAKPGVLHRRWESSRASLRGFQLATDDDTRQARILEAGRDTLVLSLALLAILAIFALIFGLPALMLPSDPDMPATYLAAGSVGAIAWWLVRRRAR